MGMRRRRKKLTTVLANLDRGVRSATLKQVKRQTPPSGSDYVEELETTTTTEPPVGTQIAVDPPDQWAKIIGGYYYPPTKTGGLGQVELFISEDLQLSVSDKMYVSGTEVKYNQTSGGKTYTGSFRPNTGSYASATTIRVVSQYGNPSWSTRAASTKPTYASIPSGVTNSILYTVTNKDYIPSRVTLSFRGTVSSYYASTTTATVTFTAAHHFVVGHIVDVSDLGSPMSDVDGIVRVSAVPSSTQISYEFKNPLGSSITTTTPSTTSYVNAVVSKYTTIGSSWIDTSVTPNKVWIWDGFRWTSYTEALEDGLVTNDGIAPAPPTGLSLSSLGYAEEGVLGKVSKSSVALSWTAPTTNANGGSLNDLAGYRIWYSTESSTGPWIGKENFGQQTSQTIVGLTPDLTYYFKVIAYDSYGLDSTGLDGSILAEKAALSVEKPSAPTLTTRLGTIKVDWDGKDYTNTDTPLSILAYVEVHYSTSTGFTPSASTLLGKIYGGKGFVVATDLEYNTDYYFKLIAVDINKRSTASSTQATAKVLPLVDADLIAAKLNAPLSSWPFAPKAVTAGALADGALDASTVFGPGVITQDAISANAIGANQIAANAITAGKINAGAVTAAKIDALAVTSDKIAANAITADKIAVGTITATQISSSYVYAGYIDANKINAGELVGFTIRSQATGNTRVEIIGANASFYFGNTYCGKIEGSDNSWSNPTTLFLQSANTLGQISLENDYVSMDYVGSPSSSIWVEPGQAFMAAAGIYLNGTVQTSGDLDVYGTGKFERSGLSPLISNRINTTATVNHLSFGRGSGSAASEIGTISSTNTGVVSYNPFMGSHYTEVVGDMPTLLGTLMETVGDLVEVKYAHQERLPKTRISMEEASTKIIGVFCDPPEDFEDKTEDSSPVGIHIPALGASWIRMAPGFEVELGDLVESNGDGCARPQGDTVMKSSTVGKIVSLNKSAEYMDGSYVLPCILYCG